MIFYMYICIYVYIYLHVISYILVVSDIYQVLQHDDHQMFGPKLSTAATKQLGWLVGLLKNDSQQRAF